MTNLPNDFPWLGTVLTMNGCSHSKSESGCCNACGQQFTCQGDLTKHRRNHCAAAHRHSKEHWRHARVNLIELVHAQKLQRWPIVGSCPCSVSGADHGQAASDLLSLSDMVCSFFLVTTRGLWLYLGCLTSGYQHNGHREPLGTTLQQACPLTDLETKGVHTR